jgi:phage protein D
VSAHLPAWRVTVNGEDISAAIKPRLVSLMVTDEAGIKSDSVEIVLADHLGAERIEIPPTGAEIEVVMGYDGNTRDMGLFIADEVTVEGAPDVMRIRAAASVHGRSAGGKTAITAQNSRSWPAGTLLGDMVKAIAAEHGLAVSVSDAVAAMVLPHIDQINESDISLLTRIALSRDLVCKPAGGRLVVVARGEGRTASGAAMPSITLRPADVSRWSMSGALRNMHARVVATYQDTAGGGPAEVEVETPTSIVGAGARGDEILAEASATKRLRRTYPDRATAIGAATAEADKAKRDAVKLSLTMPGNPDLSAEARITLEGFRPGVDRAWIVTSVRHTISGSGYQCSLTAELPG